MYPSNNNDKKGEVPRPRQVSFNDDIAIAIIPVVEFEQYAELYYNQQDFEVFKQAEEARWQRALAKKLRKMEAEEQEKVYQFMAEQGQLLDQGQFPLQGQLLQSGSPVIVSGQHQDSVAPPSPELQQPQQHPEQPNPFARQGSLPVGPTEPTSPDPVTTEVPPTGEEGDSNCGSDNEKCGTKIEVPSVIPYRSASAA
mmetsp:Transcript_609/g.1438  ORF Transcript_609/g.1438 Transcript_609/m.1438 type:complete len:197 (+) Transcript_609:47-637(+)